MPFTSHTFPQKRSLFRPPPARKRVSRGGETSRPIKSSHCLRLEPFAVDPTDRQRTVGAVRLHCDFGKQKSQGVESTTSRYRFPFLRLTRPFLLTASGSLDEERRAFCGTIFHGEAIDVPFLCGHEKQRERLLSQIVWLLKQETRASRRPFQAVEANTRK